MKPKNNRRIVAPKSNAATAPRFNAVTIMLFNGIIAALLLLPTQGIFAQNEKPKIFEFSGYLKEMTSFYVLQHKVPISQTQNMQWTWYNLVHNRLNFTLKPCKDFKIKVEMRNRFLCGDLPKVIPKYGDILATDNGVVDLSWNILNKNGFIFNTSLDRLYLDYTIKKVQIKLGRHRVNWGIGLVWNPNDIFNSFSYIDFDYEERPGSDAVSVTWYNSATSSLGVVAKVDKNPLDSSYHATAAARYLFNAKDYDFQCIAGISNDDLMTGFGWSGAIKNVSFRGEMSLFIPVINRNINKTLAFCATTEVDYTFANSIYLHGALLFNSLGKLKTSGSVNLFATQNSLNAKMLAYGMFEVFAAIRYPFNPILSGGMSVMFNPADLSAYLSPNLTISIIDDLELLFNVQLLLGSPQTEYAANGNILSTTLRLKWSF